MARRFPCPTTTTLPVMKSSRSSVYLSLRPRTVSRLFSAALSLLWGWFLLKFFLNVGDSVMQTAIGLCALGGLATAIAVFLSDTSFIAHAPEPAIDEFQLAQRNRAYVATLRYGSFTLVAAWLGSALPFAGRAGITVGVLQNFIFVLFVTMLIAPAGFLARASDDLPAEDLGR